MQRVLRWDVPVDDQWHDIGAGYVLDVAARAYRERPGDLVEVWTLEHGPDTGAWPPVPMRSVTVVGTGHPVPENTEHVGSAVVPTLAIVSGPTRGTVERVESVSGLVWHVFAKYDPAAERARLAEGGRRLASMREDLIAQGVDPNELPVPLHPDPLPPLGNRVDGIVRSAKIETLEDEATSLAYWMANELGEHVDDQDGESLTGTVRRLLAIKIARDDAPVAPIRDWGDFRIGDVVVQNPAGPDDRDDGTDFLVRRPGAAPAPEEPNIGGFTRGQLVRIDSINLDDHQGKEAVVATLDHDHGWRLWVVTGDDRHDPAATALYVSPDDLAERS